MTQQLLTTQEVCERLRISEWTLRRRGRRMRPRLKGVRFGRAVRYAESEVARLVEAHSRELR